jgi:Leucine-rich repeat (LRR) protein
MARKENDASLVVHRITNSLAAKPQDAGLLKPQENAQRSVTDYHSVDTLWKALMETGGCVKLVSANWLVRFECEMDQAKQSTHAALPRRQDLPPAAFINAEKLRKMYNEAPKNCRAPIVAVSQFWHAPAPTPEDSFRKKDIGEDIEPQPDARTGFRHPDPEGFTLALIARALREHQHVFERFGYDDIGVFIPWCSCFQPPRAPYEVSGFQRSQRLVSLWFTHSLVTVFLCTAVPPGQLPFLARGWNAFENACTWLLKTPYRGKTDWPLVMALEDAETIYPEVRPPPAELEAFEPGGSLCDVFFKLDWDRGLVSEIFQATLRDALEAETALHFDHNEWNDEEVEAFGRVLPLCKGVTRLCLSGNPLITSLPQTVCSLFLMDTLYLHGCASMTALPDEIGSLTLLRSLYLPRCTSLAQLPETIGNMKGLRQLDLARCVSLRCLPESIGCLPLLQALYLDGCVSLEGLPERLPPLAVLHASGCSSLTTLTHGLADDRSDFVLSPRDGPAMALRVNMKAERALQEILLYDCSALVFLPDNLDSLRHLTFLDLRRCTSLIELPASLNSLVALRTLHLEGCSKLRQLPRIDGLRELMELDLRFCSSLVALPDGLANLPQLDTLTLRLDGCTQIPSAVRLSSTRPDGTRIYREYWEPDCETFA